VVEVDRLPQQGGGAGQIVDLLQDPGEGGGEGPVEVGVAEHDPGIAPSDGRTELLGQVEEVLLLAAHHGDVSDARLVELADLALDEGLTAHAQGPLGVLVGDGGEALGQARGHDDGVVHAVRLRRLQTGVRDAPPADDAAAGLELAHGGVDASQGHARGLVEPALGEGLVGARERVEDVELGLGERSGHRSTIRSSRSKCLRAFECSRWPGGVSAEEVSSSSRRSPQGVGEAGGGLSDVRCSRGAGGAGRGRSAGWTLGVARPGTLLENWRDRPVVMDDGAGPGTGLDSQHHPSSPQYRRRPPGPTQSGF